MKFTRLTFLSAIFLLSFSCCDDAETIRLSDLESQFIPYEINDTILYKNLVSEEITEFVVTDIESEFLDNDPGGAMLVGPCDSDLYETKILKLESENCFMNYSVSVLGRPAGIRFSLGSNSCDILSFGSTNNNGQNLLYQDGTYVVDGILYEPVYQLNNTSSRILVTPGVGILSFIDENTGEEYVFVD